MIWGPGCALGLLAILGYALFVCGAILLWAKRLDVPTWVNDELGAVRRSVIRHAVSGTSHGLRKSLRTRHALPISAALSPDRCAAASIVERFCWRLARFCQRKVEMSGF